MNLSRTAKESIKTALAMVIAYGIALAMDWDKPYWAGFTVALISLPTTGMSLNQGAMRFLGTLVGCAAGLALIALFPQERWWFMAALSVYLGVFAYTMVGHRYQYFYQVSAFVCVIVSFGGGPNAENAFETAVTRGLETGLGVVAYTLVTVLLWPLSTRKGLEEASRQLFAIQRRLYGIYLDLLDGGESPADLEQLRLQEHRLLGQLGQALRAAETDTYEVWEMRRHWQWFQRQSMSLRDTLEHLRLGIPEVQRLELPNIIPNFEAFRSEVALRLTQIEQMLAGQRPDQAPQTIMLSVDGAELGGLSHFQKAALAMTKARLDELETLSRSLYGCILDIKGFASDARTPPPEKALSSGLAIDFDRIEYATRVLSGLWLAFLVWIYIDPPGHSGVVSLVVPLSLAFALMPQLKVTSTFVPAILSCAVAGVLYIFLLPRLSGFAELALLLFSVTFAVTYFLSKPQQALARLFCLTFFLSITAVDNQQTYSFIQFASTTLMIITGLSILAVTAYIPTSPRPEKVFLKFLRRYFRQAEFLIARLALDWEQTKGLSGRWQTSIYRNDLLRLPERLAAWSLHIDYRASSDNSPGQVQALVARLEELAYRIKILVEACEYPQADVLVRGLHDDLRAWRLMIENRFRIWAENPAVGFESGEEVRDRLAALLSRFQNHLNEIFGSADKGNLRQEDYENAYRVLGGFRGLSEAMIGYARVADEINWSQWREERF